jgi:hypothetical protein
MPTLFDVRFTTLDEPGTVEGVVVGGGVVVGMVVVGGTVVEGMVLQSGAKPVMVML